MEAGVEVEGQQVVEGKFLLGNDSVIDEHDLGHQQHYHQHTPPSASSAEAFSSLIVEDGQLEPVYVNEKQYARILKRRAARAKLEMEGRIPKQRRVSL